MHYFNRNFNMKLIKLLFLLLASIIYSQDSLIVSKAKKTIILRNSTNKPFDLESFLKAKDFPDCDKTRIDINKNKIYTSCYASGDIEELTIKQPNSLLNTVRFYENGNKRNVVKSKGAYIEGVLLGYHRNGVLADSTNYKDGAMYGVSKTFYNNGALRSKRTYHQENSLAGYSQAKDGYWEVFYVNGQLELTYTIKNGQWNGKRVSYHKNGKVDKDQNYTFGKYDGVFKEYRTDGSLYELRLFKNDKRIGIWKNFTDKGVLTLTEEYKEGKLIIRTEYFYEEGILEKTVSYNNGVRSEKLYH